MSTENFNRSLNRVIKNQAEWTVVDGVNVLRVSNSSFVAAPCTGRKNSARFDVINLDDRSDVVCHLTNKEVYGWLCKKAISENAE